MASDALSWIKRPGEAPDYAFWPGLSDGQASYLSPSPTCSDRLFTLFANRYELVRLFVVQKTKTYNSRDSLVVTHPTTNRQAPGLSTAERTGSPVFHTLWSYVQIFYFKGNITDPFLNIAVYIQPVILLCNLTPGPMG